jgi:hypothetical protein
MANVVVVGAQWGDEGKGKIVDWLSSQADVVVRFQGGHNAGHTLVIDGKSSTSCRCCPRASCAPASSRSSATASSSIPGIWSRKIERLRKQGVAISPVNLRIADNATLILPLHRELDHFRETSNAGLKIGTTKRGIGPAYEDKVGRRAIRVIDLKDPAILEAKIERCSRITMRCGAGWASPRSRHRIAGAAEGDRAEILPYADTVWALLDAQRRAGKRILFEGAQGALLDVDHGTYPFVTSSNIVAGQAATGSGLGPGGRLCAGHRQGLYDARRRRPLPDRAVRRDRRIDRPEGQGIRRRHRAQAPLRLVRRLPGPPDGQDLGHRRHRLDQARHSRRLRRDQGLHRLQARRRIARTSARPARATRPVSSRSTRRSTAGKARPPAPVPGPICRRRRSNMSAASRN